MLVSAETGNSCDLSFAHLWELSCIPKTWKYPWVNLCAPEFRLLHRSEQWMNRTLKQGKVCAALQQNVPPLSCRAINKSNRIKLFQFKPRAISALKIAPYAPNMSSFSCTATSSILPFDHLRSLRRSMARKHTLATTATLWKKANMPYHDHTRWKSIRQSFCFSHILVAREGGGDGRCRTEFL